MPPYIKAITGVCLTWTCAVRSADTLGHALRGDLHKTSWQKCKKSHNSKNSKERLHDALAGAMIGLPV